MKTPYYKVRSTTERFEEIETTEWKLQTLDTANEGFHQVCKSHIFEKNKAVVELLKVVYSSHGVTYMIVLDRFSQQ